MTVTALLALFVLLAIACISYFVAERMRIPYTVLLVAVGILLVPVSTWPLFSFLRAFQLTPELLFYLFLPILIFEAAYNMRVRHLQENIVAISLLSVVSLVISASVIAAGLYFGLQALGFAIPLLVAMVFGVIISATDPVAVLALFKEYGAPRRLSLLFEGESLFNDGTAVALFVILLEVVRTGYHGMATISEGVSLFFSMVVGGILFGVVMGIGFSKLMAATRSNTNVSIILMLVLAHLTFIMAEVISHNVVLFGTFPLHISPIIATTIASIIMGNYGRYKVAPRAEEFVGKFWEQFAFIVNALVFILMGLILASLSINVMLIITPILFTVVVVALGRVISIYPVVGVLNALKVEESIPLKWQHLMAWGSLRGAIAVTMVLLIPGDWIPAGWAYDFTPKELITGLTISCIYATLFIKALTIGPLLQRMGLNTLTDVEKIECRNANRYIQKHVISRLDVLKDKNYIDAPSYTAVKRKAEHLYGKQRKKFTNENSPLLIITALNIRALGVERFYLHDLFMYEEVTDRIVRRINAMIDNQIDKLEHGEELAMHPGSVEGDWLDKLISVANYITVRPKKRRHKAIVEKYLYYRAKIIITRKVVKEMTRYSHENVRLFAPDYVKPVIERYKAYKKNAEQQVEKLLTEHEDILKSVNLNLACKAVEKHQHLLLDELLQRDIISPKVYINLRERMTG